MKIFAYDPEDAWGNVGPYDLVPVPGTLERVAIVDSRTNETVETVEGLSNALTEAGRQCNFDNELGLC